MPRLSRFQVMQHVKPHIVKYFEEQGKRIYSIDDISSILRDNKAKWMLSAITGKEDFLTFLVDNSILKEILIRLPKKEIRKYIYGNVSEYEVALSINKNSYLSHYTAVFLHGLTDYIPKNIYTNFEQKEKYLENNNVLHQENIDRAFSRPMRKTNQIAQFGDSLIYLLNGKNVNKIGVVDFSIDDTSASITNIERTLIDITVRPNYAGGIQEVLNAYIAAKGRCSVNKIVSFLKKMAYTYPYHQAIGFYLEKAGYDEKVLKLLEKIDIKYNFYLTYEMNEKEFSKRWKLFFPKGF